MASASDPSPPGGPRRAGRGDDDLADPVAAVDAPVESVPLGRRHVGGRDLPMAIGVGVLLAGSFLGSLFVGVLPYTLVISTLVVLAMWDATDVLGGVGLRLDRAALIGSSLATIWLTYHLGHDGQVAGVALTFLVAVLGHLFGEDRTDLFRRISVTVFMGLWVGFLASYAVLLRQLPDGVVATLGVIGAVIFGDIGGFAFGVRFGRTKISPRVSPNKSLEGLLGGLLLSVGLAVLVLPRVGETITVTEAIGLAVLGVLGGFLGDLVESMVKRDLGVKDFGRLLPGHGGALDRVDGILLALPLGWYALLLLG